MEKAGEIVPVWLLLERVLDFIVLEIKQCNPEQYPPFVLFSTPLECSPLFLPSSQVVSKEHPDVEKM